MHCCDGATLGGPPDLLDDLWFFVLVFVSASNKDLMKIKEWGLNVFIRNMFTGD